MKKLLVIIAALILMGCGSITIAKVKIVYVTEIDANKTTCNVGYIYATSPEDIIRGENVMLTVGTKEQCEELSQNIGRIYTFKNNLAGIESMRREER